MKSLKKARQPIILAIGILLLILTVFPACKKDKNPITPPAEDLTLSQWQIDSIECATHQVFIDSSANAITLSGTDNNSNFSITFYRPDFPKSGSFTANCDGDSTHACIQISYKTKTYRENPIHAGSFTVSTDNNQTSIQLEATPFYNTDGTSDSVLVSGLFRIP